MGDSNLGGFFLMDIYMLAAIGTLLEGKSLFHTCVVLCGDSRVGYDNC